ncbi:MAG: SPASM domain-containing protein, partial [Gammaproteobacteria bacterium]
DTLSISLYDGPEQIEKFHGMMKDAGIAEEKVLLRRRYFSEGNYGINMTNRGGLVDSESFQASPSYSPPAESSFPKNQVCFYPFYMLTVDVGGNVTICSHDWAKNYIVGNFGDTPIFEIWTGARFELARKKLSSADRSLPSCQNCDALGDLIGRESFEHWISKSSELEAPPSEQ